MSFLRALQVLTRLPVPVTGEPPADWLSRAAKWFPLIGIGIGAVGGAIFFMARQAWPTGALPAVLAIAATVLLTGGLHEDGLADVADGFGAGGDGESRLRIMKDSHIGAYGVLALILSGAAKIAALTPMTPLQGLAALVAAHGLGRAGCAMTMVALTYVRPAESSKFGPMNRPSPAGTIFANVTGVVALMLLPFPAVKACLAAGVLAGGGMIWLSYRKIGGYTGDVLGAVEQVVEVAVLAAAAGALR